MAYILVRQVTGLLQRTKLNVSVACQAWHAKNARRMLLGTCKPRCDQEWDLRVVLDIIDFEEPAMVIVGSRGLGKLKGCVKTPYSLSWALIGTVEYYLDQRLITSFKFVTALIFACFY